MSVEPFIEGDSIKLEKRSTGWQIEMRPAKGPGFIAPGAAIFATAEEALAALSKQAKKLKRD